LPPEATRKTSDPQETAFNNIRECEIIPGPKATSGDMRDLARTATASFGHAVGTCKMGTDKFAVVDPELCAYGIDGLRIVDSSVIPRITTAPTIAPTQMVAGKAARMILASSSKTA
jgi:choline dehydrogenase-like flavoprotein